MATLTATRSDIPPAARDSAAWDVGVATGLIRIFAGIALWRVPSTLIRLSGGSPDDGLLRAVFRYFAVRDVALGVATLASTRPGGDVTRYVALQGVADTVDGAAVGALVATGRLRRTQGIGAVGLATVTALMEYATAWKLRHKQS
jgi:hypothetical protein